jgi:hypothetical protein
LVELFPTNIRYTSMSLPYHLGNGWFGGFLPLIATAVTSSAAAKDAFGAASIYAGLIYPIAVCLVTLVIGGIFITETREHKIDTALRPREAGAEAFDWNSVLIALGLGFVILLAAKQGFWTSLIGSAAVCALPGIFFRLEFSRVKALVLEFACLGVTAAISYVLYPVLVGMGGMFKFFAAVLVLGIYTAVLAAAYSFGRSRTA